MLRTVVCWTLIATCLLATPGALNAAEPIVIPADAAWRVLSRFSGKASYYTVERDTEGAFLRAHYLPPSKTVILYRKLQSEGRYHTLRWRWRVHAFPQGADERVEGRMDSAAAVYAYFETTLRKYIIKYVWSVKYAPGLDFRTADSSMLTKMQLVVREGPPPQTQAWRSEEVDLAADFKRFFGADVDAPLVGLGLLSDGDGTRSEVQADYAGFELER